MAGPVLIALSVLLASCGGAAADYKWTESLVLSPTSCSAFEHVLNTYYYNFKVSVTNQDLPANCTPSQVLVSDLFVRGSCIYGTNANAGCGGVMGGGEVVPATGTGDSVCETVFLSANPSRIKSLADADGSGKVFSSDACSNPAKGLVFVENNCAGPVAITLQVQAIYSSSCYYNYYDDWWWPTWATITLTVLLCVCFVAICGTAWYRRRKRAQMSSVQMSEMPGYQPFQPSDAGFPAAQQQQGGAGAAAGEQPGYYGAWGAPQYPPPPGGYAQPAEGAAGVQPGVATGYPTQYPPPKF